jgi:hypothetical protein
MEKTRKNNNPAYTNFLVDGGMFAAFLIAMDTHFTGNLIHEWLCLTLGCVLIIHLLLHWRWITEVSRRFTSNVARQARINYILNLLLFVDMVVIMFTGIMISKSALPSLGIQLTSNHMWKALHSTSADLAVFILGLHVALHWKWIANVIGRLFSKRVTISLPQPQKEAVR